MKPQVVKFGGNEVSPVHDGGHQLLPDSGEDEFTIPVERTISTTYETAVAAAICQQHTAAVNVNVIKNF